MPPGNFANRNLSLPLVKLLDAELLAEGDMIYYKMKGQVRAFGQARRGGIEVAGKAKLLGFSEFEQHAGSAARRASTYMFVRTGETVQSLLAKAGRIAPPVLTSKKRKIAQWEEHTEAPPMDESDEACAVCCLGGDLLCCEACPAVFHLGCLGLMSMPEEDDWHCPACVCARSGGATFGVEVEPACQVQWISAAAARLVPLEEAATIARLPPKSSKVKRDPGWDLYLRTLYDSELEPVGGLITSPAGSLDSHQDPNRRHVDHDGSGAVTRHPFVRSPLSGRRYLMSTLSEKEAQQVTSGESVWFPTEEERQVSYELSRMAALGLQPVLGGPGQGKMCYLLIRGAAVSDTPFRGFAPAYSKEQKEDLKAVLAAVRKLFEEAFDPLLDSRTGTNLLAPLLAGGRQGGGNGVDLSGFLTAVLWRGGTVVAAAVFRAFGDSLAQIPLLATRPQSGGKSYGAKLLTCVQQSLHAAGVRTAMMPALVTTEGESLLAAAAAAGAPAGSATGTGPIPGGPLGSLPGSKAAAAAATVATGAWPSAWAAHSWPRREGFVLPVEKERLKACAFPLLRLVAVLQLAKVLAPTALPPPSTAPCSHQPLDTPDTDSDTGAHANVSLPGVPPPAQPHYRHALPAVMPPLPAVVTAVAPLPPPRSFQRDLGAGPASGVLSQLRARQLASQQMPRQHMPEQGVVSDAECEEEGRLHHQAWRQHLSAPHQQEAWPQAASHDRTAHPGSAAHFKGAAHSGSAAHQRSGAHPGLGISFDSAAYQRAAAHAGQGAYPRSASHLDPADHGAASQPAAEAYPGAVAYPGTAARPGAASPSGMLRSSLLDPPEIRQLTMQQWRLQEQQLGDRRRAAQRLEALSVERNLEKLLPRLPEHSPGDQSGSEPLALQRQYAPPRPCHESTLLQQGSHPAAILRNALATAPHPSGTPRQQLEVPWDAELVYDKGQGLEEPHAAHPAAMEPSLPPDQKASATETSVAALQMRLPAAGVQSTASGTPQPVQIQKLAQHGY